MPKKPGKKRNKVDPLIALAEKNKRESLARAQAEKNDKIIKQTVKKTSTREQESTNRFFNEMKKRDF